MLARLAILAFALGTPALAAQPLRVPAPRPPAFEVIPVGDPREWQLLTWQVSDGTCAAGVRIAPLHLSMQEPQMQASPMWGGPPEVTFGFALDAEGRPFSIAGSAGNSAQRNRLQMRDLMPALRASRFAVEAP